MDLFVATFCSYVENAKELIVDLHPQSVACLAAAQQIESEIPIEPAAPDEVLGPASPGPSKPVAPAKPPKAKAGAKSEHKSAAKPSFDQFSFMHRGWTPPGKIRLQESVQYVIRLHNFYHTDSLVATNEELAKAPSFFETTFGFNKKKGKPHPVFDFSKQVYEEVCERIPKEMRSKSPEGRKACGLWLARICDVGKAKCLDPTDD